MALIKIQRSAGSKICQLFSCLAHALTFRREVSHLSLSVSISTFLNAHAMETGFFCRTAKVLRNTGKVEKRRPAIIFPCDRINHVMNLQKSMIGRSAVAIKNNTTIIIEIPLLIN